MTSPLSAHVSYWMKAHQERRGIFAIACNRSLVKIPLSRGILLYLFRLFFHGYYYSSPHNFPQSFGVQLLRNCYTDLPEIFSHDTSTIGLLPLIFQFLIRIMDHDPDHFKDFQKNVRISKTTWRIFNIFISNESSHWSLQSLLQKLRD